MMLYLGFPSRNGLIGMRITRWFMNSSAAANDSVAAGSLVTGPVEGFAAVSMGPPGLLGAAPAGVPGSAATVVGVVGIATHLPSIKTYDPAFVVLEPIAWFSKSSAGAEVVAGGVAVSGAGAVVGCAAAVVLAGAGERAASISACASIGAESDDVTSAVGIGRKKRGPVAPGPVAGGVGVGAGVGVASGVDAGAGSEGVDGTGEGDGIGVGVAGAVVVLSRESSASSGLPVPGVGVLEVFSDGGMAVDGGASGASLSRRIT